MDIVLLVVIATITLLAILGIGFFFNSKSQKVENQNRAAPVPRPRNDGPPRRAQAVRNRGVRQRGRLQMDVSEDDEEDAGDHESPTEISDEKMGAKKRAKLEAKAEKKAQREADDHQRLEKKKREQEAEKERKLIEDKQRAEEKRLEQEEKKAKEDKERKEHEEYLKMKEAFSVEEEGFEEEGCGDESQNLLQEFVNYIKMNKVVVIEDLAAHFKLKTQAAIDRIQDLLNDNILTGVIDDRGKFIYVSLQEMEAVAKFIKQRGRVSISELAENSNQLINLTPTSIVN